MDNLRELGQASLNRFENMVPTNPRIAVEQELDYWEENIFPLCDIYKIPRYQFLIEEILSKVGFTELTEANLRDTVRRVRDKRGSSNKKAASPITSSTVPSPISPQINLQTRGDVNEHQSIVPTIKAGKIVPDWKYQEEKERLERDGLMSEWTDTDERIYQYMKQVCDEHFIDIRTEYYKLDKHFRAPTSQSVVSMIYSKRTQVGLSL